MTTKAYPLTWPDGWKRLTEQQRNDGRFGKWKWGAERLTVSVAVSRLVEQLRMMGVDIQNDVIISTNLVLRLDGLPRSGQREPADPGAAVYFQQNGETRCIAVDQYTKTAQNIVAIAKTLEALRGIARWGSAEILNRAFRGFTALPAPDQAGGVSWRVVLDCPQDVTALEAHRAYRKMRSRHHPDNGGDPDKFHLINSAWAAAQQELS